MSGNADGTFGPTKPVTNEQAAQVVKNAENFILPLHKYEKKTGTIESIVKSSDYTTGSSTALNTINV